ncbi:MAG: single-stranded DNA-binding protein [Nocardioidaceae bacterium]|nr:single-stranded DNA-binding protein [Nocardioidaceae bacterium]
MKAQTTAQTTAQTRATGATRARNEVVLCGRVAAAADERELPSGDCIMTARIIVDRDQAALSRSAQRVDTIDCVAWTVRVQRSMRIWEAGDYVRLEGSIRRRFFRGDSGAVSRVEVEIKTAKRIDRAATRHKDATPGGP